MQELGDKQSYNNTYLQKMRREQGETHLGFNGGLVIVKPQLSTVAEMVVVIIPLAFQISRRLWINAHMDK